MKSPIIAATLELTQVDVASYDLKNAVRELASHGVNAVIVFGIGYLGGESYYPSTIARPHPQLGRRDFLQEACDVTAELDISCIGYVNSMFGGPDVYGPNPDWIQARSDGSATEMGQARALCPNSPYGDRIVDIVTEIGSRYPLDGMYLDEPSFQTWCACRYCRDEFESVSGTPLPLVADWTSPTWRAFLSWRFQRVTTFVDRCSLAFKRKRPTSLFFCQHAFPMASTAIPFLRMRFNQLLPQRVPADVEGWSRPLFYGQSLEQTERSIDVLSAEVWRRLVDRPVWWPGAVTSYLFSLAEKRPVLTFLEYPNFPWSLQCLPDDELAYLLVDVRANGGNPWFPVYAPSESDQIGWSVIAGTNAQMPELPPGAHPSASIVVGYSAASASLSSRQDVERDYFDGFLGTLDLLRKLHRPYRVIALDRLRPEHLVEASELVLIDARAISDEASKCIAEFVHSGGRLTLIGRNGTHSLDGSRRESATVEGLIGTPPASDESLLNLGIAYVDLLTDGSVVPVQGTINVLSPPEGAAILGEVRSGYQMFEYPSSRGDRLTVLFRQPCGTGQVTRSALNPGFLHRRFHVPSMTALLAATVHFDADSSMALNAPQTVAIYEWGVAGRKDFRIAYLLNETGIEQSGTAIPVGPIVMRAKWPRKNPPPSVSVEPRSPFDVKQDADEIIIEIETIGVWAVVQIGGRE